MTYLTPKCWRSGKTIFMTRAQAESVGEQLNLNVYKCPDCIGWHLTNAPGDWEGGDNL